MYQKSYIPDFSDTDEAGSRVLASNIHKVYLAQLVTCDHEEFLSKASALVTELPSGGTKTC
jgi:hypothetical protein